MKKDFSVIIPAFNEGKTIEEAIKSVRRQDYSGKIELIVVDNMSADNTVDISRKYADRILTYALKQNAAATRNFGGNVAQGNYIAFLDADSRLSENALTEAEKSISQGFVGGTTRLIAPERNIKARIQTLILNTWVQCIGPIYTPYTYATNEAFHQVDGWDERKQLADEIAFLKRLEKYGRLTFDRNAFVETSPRRYIKEGYIAVTAKGILGQLGFNLEWKPVRE